LRRLLALATLLLAGCAVQERPFTYTDQKEMAGRPGLFTGKPGAIILFRDKGSPLLADP